MIDNFTLKLGLAGLALALLCVVWFVVRVVRREGIPVTWILGLGALFFLSFLAFVGSQVKIVSELAPDDPAGVQSQT